MIKKCLICGKEFETIKYGGARKYCFDCSPKNGNRTVAITAIRHSVKQQLVNYKGGKCEICGYDKCIAALQFHHLDPNEKDFEIGDFYNNCNGKLHIEDLYAEVDKCQLLCANCHLEKHFNE